MQLKPYSKIVMKWRLRSWKPESHFSTVEIEIEQNRDDTTLKMKQKRVPRSAVDTTKQGWKASSTHLYSLDGNAVPVI